MPVRKLELSFPNDPQWYSWGTVEATDRPLNWLTDTIEQAFSYPSLTELTLTYEDDSSTTFRVKDS